MSNRKKWRIIFSCVAIVVFIAIAVFLVLFEKYKNKNNNETEDDNSSQTQPTEEVYATSFSLNLPDTIQILVNTNVKLTSGYINITPANAIDKLTYEITRETGSGIDGITFNGDIITANSLGTYSIKFKVPKSASTNFSKVIDIVVYEDKNASHINQIANSITIGYNKNINELFSIFDSNYQIETDNKITVVDDSISGITKGESNIKFTFTKNYIQYIYNFTLTVKEQPIYEIVILNGTNNIIEIDFDSNPYAKIHYEIRNGNEKHLIQDVIAVSSDEAVARVIGYSEPFVNIEALAIGQTTITISYSHDSSVQTQVTIIIK